MNNINGISNSNDRSNVDMNEPPDGNNQNSDQLMTSIEESTDSCQLVTETQYSDVEAMEYQQLNDSIAVNNNQPDVTFSQTEPLPPNPSFNRQFHFLYGLHVEGYHMIIIIILISFATGDVDLALNNDTSLIIEDTAIPVDLSNTYQSIKQDSLFCLSKQMSIDPVGFDMSNEICHAPLNATIQTAHDGTIKSPIIPLVGEILNNILIESNNRTYYSSNEYTVKCI